MHRLRHAGDGSLPVPPPIMSTPTLIPRAPSERDLLRMVAATTAGVVGTTFLRTLVRGLAEAFGAEAAFVAEHLDAGERAAIIASWSRDGVGPAEGSTVAVANTPCERGHLAIAVRGHDGVRIGHIGVMSRQRLDPDDTDIDWLRIFASRAGAEIERRRAEARVAASRVRTVAAADEERRRIGRDLHDGAQQDLVVLCHTLDDARRRLGDGAPAVQTLLVQAREQAERAGRELRHLAHGLYPAGLQDDGLARTLERLAARCPLPVRVRSLPSAALPAPIELAAYYVVSEALTNAVKHAGAMEVEMGVTTVGGTLVVTVRDDGSGGAQARLGSGLAGLSDRVEALGGTFAVSSPPAGGTHVGATLPLTL